MKDLMKRTHYNDLDAGLTYFLVLIMPIIIGLLLTIIFDAIALKFGYLNFTASPILYSIYIAIVSLSFLAIFFIYNKITKVNFKKAGLFKLKFGWVNLVLCVIITFVTLFGFSNLVNYFFFLLEKIGYSPDSSLPLPLTNGWWLVINLIILAVIPAICEEIIYRGIILNGFRKFGKVNAILLSSLFFALAHGSALQFIYQFILGAVLGYVLIKTGSIFASMLIHFLNNAIVIVYNYILPAQDSIVSYTPTEIVLSFVMAISASGALILLIYMLKEKKTMQVSNNTEYNKLYPIPEKKFSSGQSKLIFWIAIIISAVLWVAGTFLK